jgi:RNA polymerase sigma-70 factor, ECF subfamily
LRLKVAESPHSIHNFRLPAPDVNRKPIDLMTQSVALSELRRDLVALLPRLRRFALTQAGSIAEADNFVREACLQAVSKGRADCENDRLDLWLFRLIREQFVDGANHADRAIGENQPASSDCPSAHQMIVLDMPHELRGVLLLTEVEGLSHAEAAGILDLTASKAASRLCDARMYFADLGTPLAERRA